MFSNLDVVFFSSVSRLIVNLDQPERFFPKKLAACWSARGIYEDYLRKGMRLPMPKGRGFRAVPAPPSGGGTWPAGKFSGALTFIDLPP